MHNALKDLVACKVAGQCERDRIANEFLAGVMEVRLAARRSAAEYFRKERELPVCPPDCPPADP